MYPTPPPHAAPPTGAEGFQHFHLRQQTSRGQAQQLPKLQECLAARVIGQVHRSKTSTATEGVSRLDCKQIPTPTAAPRAEPPPAPASQPLICRHDADSHGATPLRPGDRQNDPGRRYQPVMLRPRQAWLGDDAHAVLHEHATR
jgi:hypothetical protein